MRRATRTIAALVFIGLLLAAGVYFYTHRPQPSPVPLSGKLIVHYLDIGQGDSELILLPDGETILIDAGDNGSPTVASLKTHGVTRIDLAIATHPHSDHIGEMRDVMREFEVKEFWDSGFNNNTPTQRKMLEDIAARGIKFSTPRRGETRNFGVVSLDVLNPGPLLPDTNVNNASIVVKLTFGNTRLLFTGDAEVAAWQQMIEAEAEKLEADVLKAAHHGSSNGTTRDILDAVRPSIVTISCAAGNDYHHPHPKTIQLLEERAKAMSFYRTDLDGEITVACDGAVIDVTTDKPVVEAERYLTGDEVAGKLAGGGGRSSGRRHSAGGPR